MNIKAVELLKINQNMKFGEEPVTQPAASVVETPVSQPESTLNALHQQGMNNVAFQGARLAGLKKFGISAMAALALAASTPVFMTSCADEITQTVTVDMEAIMGLYQQMLNLYQQMLDMQKVNNEQLAQLNAYMLELIQLVKDGQMTQAEFQKAVYEFMINSTANQELIINQLIQNGKTQEEANQWLQQLIDAVKSGQMSYEEALNKIMELLGSIDGKLSQILATINELKSIADALLEQQMINNKQNEDMKAYLESLFKEVQSGNMSQEQFRKVLFQYLAQDSMNQRIIIQLLIKQGKTQEQANKFLQELISKVEAGQVSYEEALKQIMEILGSIDGKLSEILAELKNISENITMFRQSYEEGKATSLKYLSGIYENGKMNTAYLRALGQGLSVVNENLIMLNNNVADLKAIAQDDTKYNALMEQLKKLEAGSIDYQKFEQMFKLLNMNITQVMNMTKDELVAAIKKFEQTYINTEKQHQELLQNINNKMNIIINMQGVDSKALQAAIQQLTNAVNSGNENVVNELKNIQAQLDKILAKLDAVLKEIGTLSSKVDTYANMFNKKFDSAVNKLINELRNGLASIKSEQQLSNQYLKNLTQKADEMLVKLDNLKQQSGNITLEQLETLLKDRDKANYEKYAKLIKDLGLKIDTTNGKLDDLIKAIKQYEQDKKDYSAQLNRIIALLEANPNYTAKLDQIIKLIENFKCNCDCGNKGGNEGIIDDLENLLKSSRAAKRRR